MYESQVVRPPIQKDIGLEIEALKISTVFSISLKSAIDHISVD